MPNNIKKEPDFKGWATVYGKLCGDGRIIKHGAFDDMDGEEVPLVYQHNHDDIEQVVGHVILHSDVQGRGMRCDGFFNDGPKADCARAAVEHQDLRSLSIWANKLTENARHEVSHGVIREVSLVLAGANPEARIDYTELHHSGISVEPMYTDAVIYSGVLFDYDAEDDSLEHAEEDDMDNEMTEDDVASKYGIESAQDLIDGYRSLSEQEMDLMNLGLAACGGAKVDDATINKLANMIDSKEESVKVKLLTMLAIASGAGDDDEEEPESEENQNQ